MKPLTNRLPADAVENRALGGRDWLAIALAVALAAVVRLVFFEGISSPDELNTLRNAAEWWTGRFDLRNALFLHDTRPLMFVPVAWAFSAGGVTDLTAVLWPLAASLAAVVLVYLIARRLLGRETAVYASVVSAFFPLFAVEATRLLPGAVMNLLIALAALFFVVSEQTERRRAMWLAASGAAFGALPMAGELGVVIVCMYLAAVIAWRRYGLWSYWPVIAGAAGVTGLFVLYQWIATGNPLFKIALGREVYAQVKAAAPHQPLYYTRLILGPSQGGVFHLAGIGCVAALARRERRAIFLVLWVAVTWALLEFGTVSLTEYRQLSKEVRYFSVVSVPVVIIAGYGLASLRRLATRWWSRRGHGEEREHRWGPAGTAVVAILSVVVLAGSVWNLRSEVETLESQRAKVRELRDRVRQFEGRTVYVTHWFWNTEVGYFMGFRDEYFPSGYHPYHAVHLASADSTSMNRYVQTLRPGEPMAPGLLIHDERLFDASRGATELWSVQRGEIPDVLGRIPPSWRLIERVTLSGRYAPALYEIPEGATWPDGER